MKRIIRLTEGDLHRVVKESVRKVLKEDEEYKAGEVHKEVLGLNKQGLKKVEYAIREPEFGGSQSIIAIFNERGKCIKIKDNTDYNHTTNYSWDQWNFDTNDLVGKSEEEVDNMMGGNFDNWEDQYRRPYVDKYPVK
jgi:hypothetical protein